MGLEQVKKLLKQKENIRLEFKKAGNALPSNLFESVCSMLNREGGDILLGVNDNGELIGVDPEHVDELLAQIVNLSNNKQKLDPPFILFPQVYDIKSKIIIRIQIPVSSQIHSTVNVIFDRSYDGDFKIIQPERIAALFNRKRTSFSELTPYAGIRFGDLKIELFSKLRNLIHSNNPNHPWLSLTDEQLLINAGLLRRDPQTGEEAYNLAAVLLLGKDDVIQSVLPFYKIDAIVRKKNTSRYDDRDYIQSNLIEAYERLMSFINKHLPDKFYLENDQRISLLNTIFREVVANFIVHREYTNAHPATLIIYPDRLETINANNAHGTGIINPDNFSPFQKNPLIAKFFIQLGRVDELGSGILNVNKYLPHYSTNKLPPQFIEGDVFKTIIPIDNEIDGKSTETNEGTNEGINEGINKLFQYIRDNEGLRVSQISRAMNIPPKTLERWINSLKNDKKVVYQGSKKSGGYYLVKYPKI